MSDGNKAEKLASAKRKLRKFQKSRDKAQNKSTTFNTEKVPPTQKSVNHTEQNGSADGEVNLDEFPHHSETAAVTPPVDVNESLQKTAEAVLENATNCVESLPSNIIENVAELDLTESEPAQQNMAAHADVSDVAASDNFDTLRVDAETPESGESTLPPPPPTDISVSADSLPNSNNNHQPAESAQTLASDNVTQPPREQEGLSSSVVQGHVSTAEMVNGDAKAADDLSTLKAPDQPTATINAGDASENDFSRTTYATETLLQISTKLNGLAQEAQAVTGGDCDVTPGEESAHMFVVSQLETRNRQLAEQTTLLNQQKQQLTLQVESVTQQMQALNVRLETEKQQIYAHGIKERNALQQQLQVQMQTIGVLVAEKQELQHQAHQSRTAATREQHLRQKCQDELRDTKAHLMAVERDLKSKAGEIDALHKSKKRAEEGRDEMESALKDVRNNVEENKMHSGELSQKLKLKEKECTRLNSEVGDLNEKLAMAEVLLQQLSSTSGGGEAESQLRRLQEERESLNLKLVEYQQAFEQLTGEREQLSRQYEDVNHQMQSRVALLSNQVEVLEKEKSALLKSHEDLKSELAEVEKKSQQLDQVESSAEMAGVREEMETKMKQLDEEVNSLKKEKAEMSTQLQRQLNNNQQLARLNEEQEHQLAQMGHNITEHQVSFEEHSRLLDQSQSDKSALSRALMQNKKLKAQLEEMQHVFVKLSNDKMELATELSTLQHKERELSDEIRLLKSSRDEMEQQVQQKDEELELLREKEQAESNHQDHVLRDELMTSQENVLLLTEQNRELKSIVSKLHDDLDSRPPPRGNHLDSRPPPRDAEPTSSTADDEPLTPPGDEREVDDTSVDPQLPRIDDASVTSAPSSGDRSDDPTSPPGVGEVTPDYDTKISELNRVVQHLQSQLAETETQRNQLASHFQLQRDQHRELSDRLAEFQALDSRRRAESDSMVASEEHEALTRDMSLLQERFAKVMRERGDALVRIDDLEHINLQLQNECDTIGEYITLYHNQRKALQQKHNEKDRYISSMARERESMQKKFERLQSLVMTLLSRGDSNSRVTSLSVTSSSRSDDDVSTLLPPSNGDVSMNTSESMTSSPEQTTWPDMLEGEENLLATTKPDLLPHSATLRSHQPPPSPPPGGSKPPSLEEGTKDVTSFPGKLQKVGEESTASQIIELLEEMQHKPAMTSSARVTSSYDIPHGFCMRYMGRYTNL